MRLCLPAAYPPLLAAATDRPAGLFVRGCLPPHDRYVAVVGTREPSPWALDATRALTAYLVAEGWSIVSGLARGIDAAAHEAALAAGGHTVAVLAGGLGEDDPIYPPEHAALAADLLARGGALVSEQVPGARSTPARLVARDRIQAGLGAGVIVTQAGLASGTLHTVRYALLQGRPLYVVRPPPPARRVPADHGSAALLLPGSACATALGATGTWRRVLEQRGACPVALPIDGPEAYAALAWSLEQARVRAAGGHP